LNGRLVGAARVVLEKSDHVRQLPEKGGGVSRRRSWLTPKKSGGVRVGSVCPEQQKNQPPTQPTPKNGQPRIQKK